MTRKSWEWVVRWKKECGFTTHIEASKAIGCEPRTWYRWYEKGLPHGLYGELVADHMDKILKRIKG